ncbi:MAG: hypothetical protein LBL82_00335 [Oscillospiraceae bacterium]|nr:hypothetical protein [Oscillospiraceae bacterium]
MSIEEELRQHILFEYGSIRQFSIAANIPNSTVETILNRGIGNANVTNIINMCKTLKISVDSLCYGKIEFVSPIVETIGAKKTHYTPHQKAVIEAYIQKPEMQLAVDRLLEVNTPPRAEPEAPYSIGRSVAYGGREMFHPHTQAEYGNIQKLAEEAFAEEEENKRKRKKELEEAQRILDQL